MTAGAGAPPGHLGDDGAPCAIHAPPRLDALLALALVGARAAGFNHDLASKLQGLMMTLEELGDLLGAGGDPELGRLAADALAAAGELVDALTAFRSLTRAQPPSRQVLRELLESAAARVGVALEGDLAATEVGVEVSALPAVQALALALDAAAGPGRMRALAIEVRRDVDAIELALPLAAAAGPAASEQLAVAAAALARDGGSLACAAARRVLLLRLPSR